MADGRSRGLDGVKSMAGQDDCRRPVVLDAARGAGVPAVPDGDVGAPADVAGSRRTRNPLSHFPSSVSRRLRAPMIQEEARGALRLRCRAGPACRWARPVFCGGTENVSATHSLSPSRQWILTPQAMCGMGVHAGTCRTAEH